MKKLILFIMLVAGMSLMQSCQYEWIDPIDPEIPEVVSFSTDIIPVFAEGCDGCHKAGGPPPDLTSANAYSSIMAGNYVNTASPETSVLYTVCIPGGSMYSYTSVGDADIILKWIQEGALNN
jgi:hypothetical protein